MLNGLPTALLITMAISSCADFSEVGSNGNIEEVELVSYELTKVSAREFKVFLELHNGSNSDLCVVGKENPFDVGLYREMDGARLGGSLPEVLVVPDNRSRRIYASEKVEIFRANTNHVESYDLIIQDDFAFYDGLATYLSPYSGEDLFGQLVVAFEVCQKFGADEYEIVGNKSVIFSEVLSIN